MPRWGIPWQGSPLDLAERFGRSAPVVLDIGFGMGETSAAIAESDPSRDFLGVEVYTAGCGALLKQIEARALTNVRIIQHDVMEVVRDMLSARSLERIQIFFPDPWPKARHHKRRLVRPEFIAQLADRLQPSGVLHCATDWEPYAQVMLQVLGNESTLENLSASADGFSPRPAYRPLTRFEARGLRLGHGVFDLLFQRRS